MCGCLLPPFVACRPDLVETIVAPAAAASAAATLADAKEALGRVAKYWARLRELRQRRTAMQAALAAADEESGLASRQQLQGGDDWDAASDAASAASGLSAYTDNTHTGNTLASSTTRASTVGGRRPQKPRKVRAGAAATGGGVTALLKQAMASLG